MNEREAVEEIIQGETVQADLNTVLSEMAAMVTLNQVLNNALWISSDKLSKVNEARDKSVKHLKHSGLEWMHEIINIVTAMTQGGTHRDKDAAQLEAIQHLMRLIKSIQWGIRKANGIAQGEITDSPEFDDIPF